ncbi:S-layer homology domain-containing protein (plasmid) [Bacillus cereus]|uniref:S-layer homology domain-containing protein n=1 Tax=Bacillus TaxID=1386 RepID=UPI00027912B1|nr:hypothetical protein IE5_05396 [Bacillus cereus BAG3X2-2]PEB95536.1 hypothetical protein CON04_29705 [Bacillus cereus]PEC24198.1 hypothetical protein CON75_30430 [Bacillus thuringiensis]PEQ71069.1 hypothetical protein CN478_28830 [Bacillus cereus]PFI67041.1 hypothetical protein COI85_29485 [Bacillus cereus]
MFLLIIWLYKENIDIKGEIIVAGYENGTYGFGDSITRGQVARLLYVCLKPVDVDAKFKKAFTDIYEGKLHRTASAIICNKLMWKHLKEYELDKHEHQPSDCDSCDD